MSQVPKDTSEAPRERPWQIMLTGPGLGAFDAATRQALERILELFTEVGGLVVQTTAGDVSVTRDFPSDYTIQVDRLLKEIFKNNPAVTGIKFLGSENPHTATPADPYWSAHGKAYACIEEAHRRGRGAGGTNTRRSDSCLPAPRQTLENQITLVRHDRRREDGR
jgi:hypothetical protein